MENDFNAEEFVRAAIAELQRDLLDFSTRNRLLSFKHSDRGTGFMRAVDELPAEIFRRLSNGGMRFKSLPHLSDYPADERTDKFREALEAARVGDEVYLTDAAKCLEEGVAPETDGRLERGLRERVRVSLGMEPLIVRGDKLDLSAFARAHEINPDYQLPYPGAAMREEHSDKFIQTLIAPSDFDRRVRKIYEAYQDHLQEKGINVLHAAFGFLEWYEDDVSNVAHHAPLLLVPLNIARQVDRGHTVHTFTAEGDEAAVNVTLQEFLKQKHQIVLPSFGAASERGGDGGADGGSELEPWLARIAEIIAVKRRWRVCRFVTIGTFPFSRIALYKDLAADSWAADALVRQDIVGHLLGGRGNAGDESGGTAGRDYPLDDPTFAAVIPSIILEADSSQHSAIVDAMEGKSFVIQGPPGTGKSQTIANIIGAALDNGRRVLFMAEKSAALNVVASRLKDRGLGPFLFEVHSDKTRKSEVIASLKERLEGGARQHPKDLERKLEQRRRLRDRLATYVSLMSEPIGGLKRQLHQLMWFETRFAQELEPRLPAGADKLTIPHAEAIDQRCLEDCRELLDRLSTARDGVLAAQQSVQRHPWRGVQETNRFTIEQIVDAAKHLSCELDCLRGAISELKDTGLDLPGEEPGLTEWVASAQRLPQVTGERHLLSLALERSDFIGNLADSIERQLSAGRRLGVSLKDAEHTAPDALAGLVAQCHALGVAPCCDALAEASRNAQQSLKELEELAQELKRICQYFGVPEAVSAEDAWALVESVRLVLATPLEVLEARTAAMEAASSVKLIANARARASALCMEEVRLNEEFDLPRVRRELPVEQLYRSADSLAGANVLSFFQSDVRNANRMWRRVARQPTNTEPQIKAAKFKEVAEHIVAVRAFCEDPRHHALFGDGFAGHHSDFDLYANAASFLRATAAAMASSGPAVHRVGQRKLIEESAENLKLLQRRVRPDVVEKLSAKLAELQDDGETLDGLLGRARQRAAQIAATQSVAQDMLCTHSKLGTTREPDGEWTAVKDLRAWQELAAQHARPEVREPIGPTLERLVLDPTPLRAALAWAEKVRQANIHPEMFAELKASRDPVAYQGRVLSAAVSVADYARRFHAAWDAFVQTAKLRSGSFLDFQGAGAEVDFSLLSLRLERALQDVRSLDGWMAYRGAVDASTAAPCGAIALAYERSDATEPRLADIFEFVLVRTLIRQVLKSDGRDLSDLTGASLDDTRARFAALDKEILSLDAERIAAAISHRVAPYGNDQGPRASWTEGALIENEVRKRRRHVAIRDLVARSHTALRALKPVWLMSPLTVAQYLPRIPGFFDLVIIDEASQMRPADAIGGIARTRQAIVVGDPMQLPPTSFFDSSAGPGDGALGVAADQSSILDLADARLRQKRMLRWHYRSRHESLIAFSNRHFYDGRLVVFPSAATSEDLGIEHVHVEGKYLLGGTNPDEAKAIVDRACKFMESRPDCSIGIATTNTEQRELILDELEAAAEKHRHVAEYRMRWQGTLEPLFVKNLENVQGDERDIILISTVFGPGESGQVAQRFGPINSEAGHRRLNVLFTRAKRKLVLVTSLTAADIIPSANANRGVHVLKAFLEFAKTGRLASGETTGLDADSDFEVHVAEQLRCYGYEVVPQVGVDGFRIDLGIKHPSYRHGFLAGIECDGATYHSGVTVRDRDRLRQEILEGLGWRLYRIWSTDWFTDQSREMRRLLGWLEALRHQVS
jgi:very-short-patch-repair endonuclease